MHWPFGDCDCKHDIYTPSTAVLIERVHILNMALNSSSQNVKSIRNMGRFGIYSIMGGNIRLLIEKYDMNVNNVVKALNERINKNEVLVGVCEQVKEVVGMRDSGSGMSQSECDDILTFLCTG